MNCTLPTGPNDRQTEVKRRRLLFATGAVGPLSAVPAIVLFLRDMPPTTALLLMLLVLVMYWVVARLFAGPRVVALPGCADGLLRWTTILRSTLTVLALTQGIILIFGIARFGIDGVNLDEFDSQPAEFVFLLLFPALSAASGVVLAVSPLLLQINLLVFFALWLLAEGVFWMILPDSPKIEGEPQSLVQWSYFAPDPVLGTRLVPHNIARHRKTIDGKLIYDVIYVIDHYGRRETPTESPLDRSRFLIFFGDSNTIGEGLNQNETLPYYAGQLAPAYRPYNYGVHGYGPAQMLDVLHTRRIDTEIPEAEGYAVYFLIPAHVARAVGSSEISASWGRHFSHYVLQSDGSLVRKGNFVTGRPLLTLLFRFLGYSNIVRYFHLVFPLEYGEADYRLVTRLILESRRILESERSVHGFVVILAPTSDTEEAMLLHEVGAMLEEANVRVLDFTHLFDNSDLRYRIDARDAHNSALANRVIGNALMRALGIGSTAEGHEGPP